MPGPHGPCLRRSQPHVRCVEVRHRLPAALTLPVDATLLLIDELLCDVALYLVTLFGVVIVMLVNVVLDDVGRCAARAPLASPRIRQCDS